MVDDVRAAVAVVTGGASGIGEGLAEALLDEGATVVIADVEATVLDATASSGSGARARCRGSSPTCRGPTASRRAPGRCTTRHGACHLLFNNAGVGGGGVAKPWNWTPNDWAWCFGVNVFGVGHCVARSSRG